MFVLSRSRNPGFLNSAQGVDGVPAQCCASNLIRIPFWHLYVGFVLLLYLSLEPLEILDTFIRHNPVFHSIWNTLQLILPYKPQSPVRAVPFKYINYYTLYNTSTLPIHKLYKYSACIFTFMILTAAIMCNVEHYHRIVHVYVYCCKKWFKYKN